jgi:hypothetical protein
VHPNEPVHLDILREVCNRFVFVRKDSEGVSRLLFADDLETLVQEPSVAAYLGHLARGSTSPRT